jgi:hypothetical protein
MRLLLIACVLALAGCPKSSATPATVPLESGEALIADDALFAGASRVTVPEGPEVVLVTRAGGDLAVLAFGSVPRAEILAIPATTDARYAMVQVPDGTVVARLAGDVLYAWCLRWEPATRTFKLMATYDGAVEDEQPFWLPDEIGQIEQ